MSFNENRAANALSGKTARACDGCLVKRARWFCMADEAYLCQACDSSVHSANQLASRHKRELLKTSRRAPAWHQGFTKKARTPRTAKSSRVRPSANRPLAVIFVPEINNGDDPFADENEEQLIYRVPVLEPFEEELFRGDDHDLNIDMLTEFAEDVETLLAAEVKMEEDDGDGDHDEVEAVIASHFDPALDMELRWDFDFATEMKSVAAAIDGRESKIAIREESQGKMNNLLRLDYEAVIYAWDTQGSPWLNGSRPHEFNLIELTVHHSGGASHVCTGLNQQSETDDAVRKASVARYKEKRRTRLFSNKIRYQVRKLNAEMRPRIKGRFVKRENIVLLGMNK